MVEEMIIMAIMVIMAEEILMEIWVIQVDQECQKYHKEMIFLKWIILMLKMLYLKNK